jgi:cytochrome c peroxidase
MVHEDIQTGLRHMNMLSDLSSESGNPIPQAAMTKIEHVIQEGSMPPEHFLLMHWNAALNDEERDKVLGSIRKVSSSPIRTPSSSQNS